MARKMTPEKEQRMAVFADRLRFLMKSRNVNQQELAHYLEVTPQAVSLYATGKAGVDLTIIHKCAQLFDVSSDYLLGLSEFERLPVNDGEFFAKVIQYTGLNVPELRTLKKAADDEAENGLPGVYCLALYKIATKRLEKEIRDIKELQFDFESVTDGMTDDEEQIIRVKVFKDGYEILND